MRNALGLRLVKLLIEHFTEEEIQEILTAINDPVILTVLGETNETCTSSNTTISLSINTER